MADPVVYILPVFDMMTEETIGPKTNSRTVKIFHPDMSQTSPDRGRTELANRPNLKSFWLPGKNLNNIVRKAEHINDNEFMSLHPIDGQNGLYVLKQYSKNIYHNNVSQTAEEYAATLGIDPATKDRQLLDSEY